ncbi:sugar ABC transporter permease [Paenibacillus sp. PAMC21692]|uniref:ABC transporter permease n=1 Tax=Paenibacillus sp. PAMC21692 TaxID=2762320 RepID=UPI00164EA363|nr:ABC transporter permease subunit [Paenibacillus sp. PAMC21692]QNK60135.1 sugar ABC transporter permease [Paenibacillus sp. PAMC21692]
MNGIRRRPFLKRLDDSKYLLLLFLPAALFYLIFEYAPMFGIVVAFKDYNTFAGVWASDWVGLKYFRIFLFENPDFLLLLRNTFLLGVYSLVWGFPAPIILALLLNELRSSIFKRTVQTVSYLPHFVSNVVIVSMITMFLSPDGGLVNKIIGIFGADPVYFLSKSEFFRTIYVSSGIWQGVGWGTIIYLAALTAVDPHLYEAAELDGAGRWKRMLHVSIPGIVPVIIILLILNIGGLLGTGFEKVFLLYNPMVYATADIFSTYTYRVGLLQGNFSYATAIGVFNGVVGFILIVATNRLAKRTQETSLW